MSDYSPNKIRNDFAASVNMSVHELSNWLDTHESGKVGWKGKDGSAQESVGHASGRTIVTILRKRVEELSAEDYLHMRKVIGFVRRHSAQRPVNIYTSRWRYSLMNWGHDPTKEDDE
jgi:cobalamin-dependent methionine synthase I